MRNATNVSKYRLLAPMYDLLFTKVLHRARRQAISLIGLKPGESLLIVGVGTGQDLPLLPDGLTVTGVDISEAMLRLAERKVSRNDTHLSLMNAEELGFSSQSFDAVLLSLVLSVVEHPQQALREAARVLKDSGRIVVFDKFLPDDAQPSPPRRCLNLITALVGTDINRRFGDILAGQSLTVSARHPALAGVYRVFRLNKA